MDGFMTFSDGKIILNAKLGKGLKPLFTPFQNVTYEKH